MSVAWSQCFLCATATTSLSGHANGRRKQMHPQPFFRYLVGSGSRKERNEPLISTILEQMGWCERGGPESESTTPSLHLCKHCRETVEQVAAFDTEMHTIQLRLTNIMEEMWATVRNNRHSLLPPSGTDLVQLLQDLYTAVLSASNQHLKIPFVYLHTATPLPHHSSHIKTEQEEVCHSHEMVDGEDLESIDNLISDQDEEETKDYVSHPLIAAESPLELEVEVKTETEVGKGKRGKRKGALPKHNKVKVTHGTRKSSRHRIQPPSSALNTPASSRVPPKKRGTKTSKPARKRSNRVWKKESRPTYRCDLCSVTVYRYLFKFEAHLRKHETGDRAHTCSECSASFSTAQYLRFHKHGHDGTHKVLCEVCAEQVNVSELKGHYEAHGGKMFRCLHCSFIAASRDRYLKHFPGTHPTGSLMECDLCPAKFTSRPTILSHLHEEHQVIPKLECEVAGCSKSFLDPHLLHMHSKVHDRSGEVTCTVCSRVLVSARTLQAHMLQHTGERPFACEQCPQRFCSKLILDTHVESRHNELKFQCHICGRDFSSKNTLKGHLMLHEGNGLPCSVCNKQFPNKFQLKVHQSTHTQLKDFVCEECGKKFRTRNLLRSHTAVHKSEKIWKCTYCPKAFVVETYLKVHLRIHTGERPYVCKTCGKDFNQRPALFTHRKTHHKDEEAPQNANPTDNE